MLLVICCTGNDINRFLQNSKIYNCEYRNFRKDDCRALMIFSKENNLLMVGVMDWHDWGICPMFGLFFRGNSKNIEKQLAKKQRNLKHR
jgi:hypothetical protein